uniref:C-type natriuretic peptide n=1 Tax=Podarcis muralis TaxID=64176 RepID=A0A670K5P8_PODMU
MPPAQFAAPPVLPVPRTGDIPRGDSLGWQESPPVGVRKCVLMGAPFSPAPTQPPPPAIALPAALGNPRFLEGAQKGKGSSSSSRLMRDLRTDTKQSRHHKGSSKSCFGLKLDRIGTISGLGC